MMNQLELELAIDDIAQILFDSGKNADEVEEILTGEAQRVAQEIRDEGGDENEIPR